MAMQTVESTHAKCPPSCAECGRRSEKTPGVHDASGLNFTMSRPLECLKPARAISTVLPSFKYITHPARPYASRYTYSAGACIPLLAFHLKTAEASPPNTATTANAG